MGNNSYPDYRSVYHDADAVWMLNGRPGRGAASRPVDDEDPPRLFALITVPEYDDEESSAACDGVDAPAVPGEPGKTCGPADPAEHDGHDGTVAPDTATPGTVILEPGELELEEVVGWGLEFNDVAVVCLRGPEPEDRAYGRFRSAERARALYSRFGTLRLVYA